MRSKKEEVLPVSTGIRGILRNYLTTQMLDAVPSSYKILVMDDDASRIINSCFKMHDIMEHGITLVVPLAKPRQPVKTCNALYFVSPKAENMTLIVRDWVKEDKYKDGPYIFVTSTASDAVLSHLAQSNAATKCRKMVDMRIDFMAPEHLLWNASAQADLQRLFGSVSSPMAISEVAEKILSVLLVAGERPCIRAYNNTLCKALASKVSENLNVQSSATADTSGTLIILDRSIDMLAPFLHEFTYEAFIADNCPLGDNNTYEVKTQTETKKVVIDLDDAMWSTLRHAHLATLGAMLESSFKELGQKFPKLMEFSASKSSASTKDLGDAVRDLPAFNAMKQNISTHQNLVAKVMDINQRQKLNSLAEYEQTIALQLNEGGTKQSAKDIVKIVADILKSDYSPLDKKRIALLAVASLGPDKVDEITKLPGLRPTDKAGLEAVGKYFDVAAKDKVSRSKKADKVEYFVSSYKPYVKTIMEQAISGTLDATAFPVISGQAEGAASAAGGDAAAAPAAAGRSGGLFARKPVGNSKLASTAATAKPVANLDLGNGNIVPLTRTGRVWIFIAGGCTYSEIRSTYEVTAAQKREVLLGATSIVRPDTFISSLDAMA